jgi:hypothetical protein
MTNEITPRWLRKVLLWQILTAHPVIINILASRLVDWIQTEDIYCSPSFRPVLATTIIEIAVWRKLVQQSVIYHDTQAVNLVSRACDPREGTGGSGIIRFKEESDWPLLWNAQFGLSQDSWLPATDYPRASRSFPRIAGSGNEIGKQYKQITLLPFTLTWISVMPITCKFSPPTPRALNLHSRMCPWTIFLFNQWLVYRIYETSLQVST